jgi:hypothetical protein
MGCFKAAQYPGAPIYGGSTQVPALSKLVKDEDEFVLGENLQVKYASASEIHEVFRRC